jgi:hypothetical protein
LRNSTYANPFRQAFGEQIFADPQAAFQKALESLQAFQIEDYSFHPYSSKFDLFIGNKIGGAMTEEEKRGIEVFSNPNKGNCFACHYSGPGLNGSSGIFTDYSFEAIGVPRNPDIPVNNRRKYYDLGLCNRDDHPPKSSSQFCGMFKTPTLRNVATRKVFFHNGRIKSLREAIEFYNTRDSNPERWYPKVNGVVAKFDDLPRQYRANIDKQGPLDGRPAGSEPPMSEQDMRDLEAFLNTLTDDYEPLTAQAVEADDKARRQALQKYLSTQGHVCVGKFTWPVDVKEADFKVAARNAVQMPALEKLGLVKSSDAVVQQVQDNIPQTIPVKRYYLTDTGREYYIAKDAVVRGPEGNNVEYHKDLCGITLTLDRIVRWEEAPSTSNTRSGTLYYTYHATPADWVRSPDARRVFPMLDRILKGDGAFQLQQRLQLLNDEWVAVGVE